MKITRLALAALISIPLAALTAPSPARAQSYGMQEKFQITQANVVGSDQSHTFVAGYTTKVFGGLYIFNQTCSSGGVNLLVLGPDNATYLTAITKTTSDTTTGTAIQLGNFSVVAAQLNGGSGCNAVLTRVPG